MKKGSLRKLTAMGLAIALVAVLAIVGTVPFVVVEATICFIPVMVLAVLEGPVYGFAVGLAAGIISLLTTILLPRSALDPYFLNPLVSVLPRSLIGLAAFFVYKLFDKIFGRSRLAVIAPFAAGAAGSLVNTAGVLFFMYIIYFNKLAVQMAELGIPGSVISLIEGIALSSGVPEAIISAILTGVVVNALKKSIYKGKP